MRASIAVSSKAKAGQRKDGTVLKGESNELFSNDEICYKKKKTRVRLEKNKQTGEWQ